MNSQSDNHSHKPNLPRTKIVATLGPSSWEEERLRSLIAEGVSVARINFSHAEPEQTAATIRLVRRIADELDRNVAILADLQGPRIRVGELQPGGITLREGECVVLAGKSEQVDGDGLQVIPVDYEQLYQDVEPGDTLLLADGMMAIQVADLRDKIIDGLVLVGGPLGSHKGINVPGRTLHVPSFTEKDREDLDFALEHGVDMVALSFVRSAEDVEHLRGEIRKRVDRYVPIISKIEKHEAVANFAEILDASDGIMVARGDLGVELPPETLPSIQKRLIAASNVAGKPVITATQMLDSMIRNFRPTRAEATDVANAVLDGTDAVMLSGETANGKYPVEAVRIMGRILREAEKVFDYEGWISRIENLVPDERPYGQRRDPGYSGEWVDSKSQARTAKPAIVHSTGRQLSPITEQLCRSADRISEEIGAAAVITLTRSGLSPRLLAKYRPRGELIAITDELPIQRSLAVSWGVRALLTPPFAQTPTILEEAAQLALEHGWVARGDLIVLTGGLPLHEPYRLNMLQVQEVQ